MLKNVRSISKLCGLLSITTVTSTAKLTTTSFKKNSTLIHIYTGPQYMTECTRYECKSSNFIKCKHMKFLMEHRLRKQGYSYNEMKQWYKYYKTKQNQNRQPWSESPVIYSTSKGDMMNWNASKYGSIIMRSSVCLTWGWKHHCLYYTIYGGHMQCRNGAKGKQIA